MTLSDLYHLTVGDPTPTLSCKFSLRTLKKGNKSLILVSSVKLIPINFIS